MGSLILAVVLYSSLAAADQYVSVVDTDGSDDLSPPGAAFLYAKVSATLNATCFYYSWSHTPGSSYAYPNPPYTWDWDSENPGNFKRDEGWTRTWLKKNGAPHLYEAFAVLPTQPGGPPCLT